MIRRALAIAAALVCSGVLVAPVTAGESEPPIVLNGSGPTPIPLKNQAMISKSDWGLRYRAGQQDSHLVVTLVGDRVRYRDTGTQEWRKKGKAMPRSCDREKVRKGIAATCRIPAAYRDGSTMFLEIWPRLGNDYVDGSQLPANVRLWALGDKGHDTIFGGAGDDFVNGAQNNDNAHGGGGDDWLRTGDGNDKVWGDGGDDLLRTVDGNDDIHGGAGADEIGCGPGGGDAAWYDAADEKVRDCETTTRE